MEEQFIRGFTRRDTSKLMLVKLSSGIIGCTMMISHRSRRTFC